MTKEYAEFYRRHSSMEFEFQQLTLNYKRASQELDDARMQLENEILVRIQILFFIQKNKQKKHDTPILKLKNKRKLQLFLNLNSN